MIAACTTACDESHPCIILQYLLNHYFCNVTQQPAAFGVKLLLLAVNDAPVRQTQHTFTPSSGRLTHHCLHNSNSLKQDTCKLEAATLVELPRLHIALGKQSTCSNSQSTLTATAKGYLEFGMDDKSCVIMFKTIIDMRQTLTTRQHHLDFVGDSHGRDCSNLYTAACPSCNSEQLTMSPGVPLQQSQEVLQRKNVCWDHSAPMGWPGTCSTMKRDADPAVGKLDTQGDDSHFSECQVCCGRG